MGLKVHRTNQLIGDWADSVQDFTVVTTTKMFVTIKEKGFGHSDGVIFYEPFEHRRGCLVGCRNCRLDKARLMTLHQLIQHRTGQPDSTTFGCYRHLPNEKHVRCVRFDIAGHECNQPPFQLNYNTRVCKVRALQKVAVKRVGIEWRVVFNHLVDRGRVFRDGLAQQEFSGIRIMRILLRARYIENTYTCHILLVRLRNLSPL